MTVGKPIKVGEVLDRSVHLLIQNPILLVPQVIAVIPTFLIALVLRGSLFSPLTILLDIVSFVLGIIVSGTYPFIVKAVVDGGQFSITDAMGRALKRFWTLLGAGILVGLLVALGTIALIVPGIILATWYAYTVPAIMLENRGATEGMSASKAFGRDKKGSTFLMFLAVGVVYAVTFVVFDLLISVAVSYLLGQVIDELLNIFLAAWVAVIISYTYITCGPSSVTPPSGDSNQWIPPPPYPTLQPGMQSSSSPSRFCASCGSPLEMDSKFCPSCGRAV